MNRCHISEKEKAIQRGKQLNPSLELLKTTKLSLENCPVYKGAIQFLLARSGKMRYLPFTGSNTV